MVPIGNMLIRLRTIYSRQSHKQLHSIRVAKKSESKNKENRYNNSMKDNQTIAQFLKVKAFPFIIKDAQGNKIYFEDSDGYWSKREYDDQGNRIYCENSNGYWSKREYDDQGNRIYYETSDGYWCKREYDDEGNLIYWEDSNKVIIDKRPKSMIELTLQDIAKLKGVYVVKYYSNQRIISSIYD